MSYFYNFDQNQIKNNNFNLCVDNMIDWYEKKISLRKKFLTLIESRLHYDWFNCAMFTIVIS